MRGQTQNEEKGYHTRMMCGGQLCAKEKCRRIEVIKEARCYE
jgi:hypothetical protein